MLNLLIYVKCIGSYVTGDCSVTSSEAENHINERVRQAIESEDIDAVVHLQHHNKGQPSKYDKLL